MPNKILFGLSATAAILLSACGDEITEVTETTGMAIVEAGEDLPNCTKDNEGAMVYAVDSAAAYFCVNRKWNSLKGKDGEDGKDGADGKDGEKGDKGDQGKQGAKGDAGEKGDTGEAGTSCTVEQLPDSSGYKVLCGGDSVGVVLNGEKGDKGDKGDQGPKGEDGKSVEGAENFFIDARDKQIYRFVTIGDQTWMADNLNFEYKVKSQMGDDASYGNHCNYDDCKTYGRYYTWAAAMDSAAVFSDNAKDCGYGSPCTLKAPTRGICPEGWHIPTMLEWGALYKSVGESPYAMQAKGFGNWQEATDAYGLSMVPAGYYIDNGFYNVGSYVYIWSATVDDDEFAIGLRMNMNSAYSDYLGEKSYGFSVRCVKD